MNFALLFFAVPICIADMHSLVIPNIYSKILLGFAAVHLSIFGFGDLTRVAISFVVLLVLLLFKIGMGDIKLLVPILLTHEFNVFHYFGLVFLLATVHIVVLGGINRTIPSRIPLASSIFIGLSTYLATG